MKKKRTKRKAKNPTGKTSPPFSKEFKLRVVQLYLEEGYQAALLSKEFKVSEYSIYRWSKLYRQFREKGLDPRIRKPAKRKQSKSVKKKIVSIRKENPSHGSRRISDILKRFFLIEASPSSVHKTLSEEGLVKKTKKKAKKNPSKPRFFERATPNQLWQSDIMTFRLGGRNAYLIGYLDDYSRYIVSLGLYRIRAEKGKIKMLVDGQDSTHKKELVYDARKDDINHEKDQTAKILRSTSENNSRVVGMDRTANDNPNVPGAVHQFESFEPVAEPGHGNGPEPQAQRSSRILESETEPSDRKEPAGPDRKAAEALEVNRESQSLLIEEKIHEKDITEKIFNECSETCRDDHEGALRSSDRIRCSQTAGGISQDLLQMGETWPCRPFGRGWRPASRSTPKSRNWRLCWKNSLRRVGPRTNVCSRKSY